MQFYRLNVSFEPTEVGTFPQVQKLEFPSTWDSPKALGSLFFEKAPSDIEIPIPFLHKKARLTDFLSVSHFGNLLISEKVKTILEKFKSIGIEFLSTSLKTSDKGCLKYWYTNVFDFGYEFLDLGLSKMTIMADPVKTIPLRELKANSHVELRKVFKHKLKEILSGKNMNENPIFITTVAIRPDIDVHLFPLWSVLNGGVGYYVSEKLRFELESAKCTGVSYEDLEIKDL